MKSVFVPTLSIAIALLVAAPIAHATPNFPGEIRSHLALAAPPQCSLCHAGGVTGRGTVTTPFGTSMRAQGLVAYDTGSLDSALDALAAAKTDSDGDCVPDIDELKAGTNPDVAEGAATCASSSSAANAPPPPSYGCELRVASEALSSDVDPFVAVGIAATFVLLRRLHRRRRDASHARSGNT